MRGEPCVSPLRYTPSCLVLTDPGISSPRSRMGAPSLRRALCPTSAAAGVQVQGSPTRSPCPRPVSTGLESPTRLARLVGLGPAMACPASPWTQSPFPWPGAGGRAGQRSGKSAPLQHPGQRPGPRRAGPGGDSRSLGTGSERSGGGGCAVLLRGAGWGPRPPEPRKGQHAAFHSPQLRVGFARVAGL